jgi:hypothetical protein
MNNSRRRFLALAGLSPIVVLGVRAAAAEPALCYDPATLSLSQKSRRRAVGFLDKSGDPARHCSLCNFFTAAAPGCGTCTILGGGPVNTGSVCNSFARKAGT